MSVAPSLPDPVRTAQRTYRRMVDALAQPGTLHPLPDLGVDPGRPADLHPGLALLALTLLDAEVRFAVLGPVPHDVAAYLQDRTYARAAEAGDAHVLVALDAAHAVLAMTRASCGTHEAPHLGATVLLPVASRLTAAPSHPSGPNETEASNARASQSGAIHATDAISTPTNYRLEGPGIDGHRHVTTATPLPWLDARNDAVADYPRGIDLFLVDPDGMLMGLPRTTRITLDPHPRSEAEER